MCLLVVMSAENTVIYMPLCSVLAKLSVFVLVFFS